MKFLYLEEFHKEWKDILVIGKTIERDDKKYHIIGMTLADEAQLYIIEPYAEPEDDGNRRKGARNHRKMMKEQEEHEVCYLHCGEFWLGGQRLEVQSGSGGSLKYSTENYEEIQVFFDMLSAGWEIPGWLKNEEWDNLQMVTLVIKDLEKLPDYSPEMPITIKHSPDCIQHILEKTVTLNVGKSHSFHFVDNYGDTVWCHINDVTLMDVWKNMEEQFANPEYVKMVSKERLEEMKRVGYEALEQNCPRGMCYINIEYECSKDISLQFYTKEYLRSYPEEHVGRSAFFMIHPKPDKETGTHNLPLKGCVIQTPISPDTSKIPAELFMYLEKVDGWEEVLQ